MQAEIDRLGQKGISKQILPLDTFLSVDLQHLRNDVFDLSIDIRLPLQLLLLNIIPQVLQISACPWRPSMQHLVKNDTHTPYITFIRELLISQDLRSSIERCSQKGQLLRLIGVFYDPTESKVTELSHALLEQDVGRLDVPMDDALTQQGTVPLCEMSHEGLCLSLTESFIFPILLQIVLEVPVLAVLQDHVDVLA